MQKRKLFDSAILAELRLQITPYLQFFFKKQIFRVFSIRAIQSPKLQLSTTLFFLIQKNLFYPPNTSIHQS